MRNRFFFLGLGLLSLLMLTGACQSARDPWRSVLNQYKADADVQELLLVRQLEGSSAQVSYYQKQAGQKWLLLKEAPAFIGKNGLGKTREGDAMTPIGDFGVLAAFGILPDPGTALPWLSVTPSTFACDEEGPYYNQIIDTAVTHHACKGEDMFHTDPEYHYGLALDYNADCHYPDGSAIFFHCVGAKTYTGGCVAVEEGFMRQILTTAHPGLRVVIR